MRFDCKDGTVEFWRLEEVASLPALNEKKVRLEKELKEAEKALQKRMDLLGEEFDLGFSEAQSQVFGLSHDLEQTMDRIKELE